MSVLNLYFSSTGNTEKVAARIGQTLRELGHEVKILKITSKDTEVDILQYDVIFAGSGGYGQLPGKALMEFFSDNEEWGQPVKG